MKQRSLSRRAVLQAAGAAVSLPFLDAMVPAFASETAAAPPKRMLAICTNMGMIPRYWFPKGEGRDYTPSDYLKILEPYRNEFTVLSGVSHPHVDGGHHAEISFLTAAPHPGSNGFRNSISLDQYAAEQLGPVTRFPSLNLGVNIDKANRSLSWTRDGVLLPAEDSAVALFKKMFIQGDDAAVQRQLHKLEERGSILDTLLDDTARFRRDLGRDDQSRLDQYLTSVREIEERLGTAREWELTPKPITEQAPPEEIHDQKLFFEKFDLMLSMARLALESDSTRIVTLMVDAFATPVFKLHPDQNTTDGYHNLSHHGQAPKKLEQLEDADRQQMNLLRRVIDNLAAKQDGDGRLLDNTMVLFGSNMGDSNTHDNTNLPILLAGGGFRHGQHLAFDHENNTPLANLYVTMLQQMGIETDRFASSTGSLAELRSTT